MNVEVFVSIPPPSVEVFTPSEGVFIEVVGTGLGGGANLPANIAFTNISNTFTQPNAFSGLQLLGKTIFSDYPVLATDNILCVNADDGPFTITLPASKPSATPRFCQWLYFKNISFSGNPVTVLPHLGDTIDGNASITFDLYGSDLMIFDAAPHLWADVGGSVGGLTLPLLLDKSRLMSDGAFLLYNPDMNTFHAIRVRGADNDSLYMQIDAGIP